MNSRIGQGTSFLFKTSSDILETSFQPCLRHGLLASLATQPSAWLQACWGLRPQTPGLFPGLIVYYFYLFFFLPCNLLLSYLAQCIYISKSQIYIKLQIIGLN